MDAVESRKSLIAKKDRKSILNDKYQSHSKVSFFRRRGASTANVISNIGLIKEVDFADSDESIDCDQWDIGSITLPILKRPNSLIGFNLGDGLQPAEGYYPQENITKIKLEINSRLGNSLKHRLRQSWINARDLILHDTIVSTKPFKYCVIDDFLEGTVFLNKVRLAFAEMEWVKRKMDLYEFFQSPDLKQIKNTAIKRLHDFFKKDVHRFISEITGMKIEKISLTCSFFSNTDFILLHDDLQRDRAIAFRLFVTDPKPDTLGELWTEAMGGCLTLYDKDFEGNPKSCVKRILPLNNRFLFFQVTNDSFHAVEEVTNMDHCRYVINGWFHTREPNPYLAIRENDKLNSKIIRRGEFKEALGTNVQLQHWIYGDYLNKNVRQQIQEHMVNDSEISLTDYFIKEKYDDLYQALRRENIKWEKVGPLNDQNYEIIVTDEIPSVVKELLLLFQSRKMFKLLRDYTKLALTPDTSLKKPSVRIEIQRWSVGSYMLMADLETPHLDVLFYIGCQLPIVGGETMYVTNDNDVQEALVSVQPTDNTLDLIYRDTCKFTRYVSVRSQNKYFYTLLCSYRE